MIRRNREDIKSAGRYPRGGREREREKGVRRWIKRGEGETSVAMLYPDYGWPPCAFGRNGVIWQPFARVRSRERVRI